MKKTGMKSRLKIRNCKKCQELVENRKNIVVGEGKIDSEILLIGEAPGKQEDIKSKPFVGKAGDILTDLLNQIDINREDIYITNIIKCRPPSNRNPKKSEIKSCTPYLRKQIKIIDPSVVISVGRVAAKTLTDKNISLKEKHGEITKTTEKYYSQKLFLTYHPAACLYNRNLEETLENDFEKLKSYLEILNDFDN